MINTIAKVTFVAATVGVGYVSYKYSKSLVKSRIDLAKEMGVSITEEEAATFAEKMRAEAAQATSDLMRESAQEAQRATEESQRAAEQASQHAQHAQQQFDQQHHQTHHQHF